MNLTRVEESAKLSLPVRSRGRQSVESQGRHQAALRRFCDELIAVRDTLSVTPESRSWCYILEGYGLDKGDFDKAQKVIGECRKNGMLPVNIVAADQRRATDGDWSEADDETPEEFARMIAQRISYAHLNYAPVCPHDYQDCYVEVVVEKGDIAKLFAKVTNKFYVPVTPMRGWADINSRFDLIQRLDRWSYKRCVVLCCTDLDPGGLRIADFLRENLAALEGATDWRPDDLEIVRFGLDADFVEANNLTWIDNLETSSGGRLDDPRHADFGKPYVQDYLERFGARKVELNALMAHQQAAYGLVRDAITPYIDPVGMAQFHDDLRGAQTQAARAMPMAVQAALNALEIGR